MRCKIENIFNFQFMQKRKWEEKKYKSIETHTNEWKTGGKYFKRHIIPSNTCSTVVRTLSKIIGIFFIHSHFKHQLFGYTRYMYVFFFFFCRTIPLSLKPVMELHTYRNLRIIDANENEIFTSDTKFKEWEIENRDV